MEILIFGLFMNRGEMYFMPEQNRKHPKRVRNLIAICTVIAVILSVSTYAWFIGMRTVHVSSSMLK